MRISETGVFRYLLAVAFATAALGLSLLLQRFLPHGFLIFFLSAVMLAGRFAQMGAGLFAAIVSIVLVDYYFIMPFRAFVVEFDELPYFLAFLFSAVVTSWLGAARSTADEKRKAHLDELFEQAPAAIMLVDLEDRILRVNEGFTHIFGYRIDEIASHPSIDLLTPIQFRSDALKCRERLAAGQHINIETIRKRKDGSCLNVSEVSFPVLANEKCIAFCSIFRDVTEDQLALEGLQKAQAELAYHSRITIMGELATSIAHEINQPICAIATNGSAAVRWLGKEQPHIRNAEEALECIVQDAHRAARVIGRIRSLLKKTPTPVVDLDMNEVIREALALTFIETARTGVTVATELTDNLPLILGDQVEMQQVMLNLVANSLEAMTGVSGRPRRLLVKSSHDSDSIFVQVEDTGNGWDDQHSTSIFDPFFTTKKDGIGMGLAICRTVIENHGGRLWAERATPQGAILKFTLPIIGKAE